MPKSPVHVPVMPREVLQYLQLAQGMTVLDGTVGAGGHSSQIIQFIGPSGQLFGFDRDPMMLQHASEKLKQPNIRLIHGSYADAKGILAEEGIQTIDRVLLDLGLSSDQLSDRDRGFGFDAGGPLDMRFDTSRGQSAADLLHQIEQSELEIILTEFGEEPYARQIATHICTHRKKQPLQTTEDLERMVRSAIPGTALHRSSKNPSTRVFQALRIAVNNELEHVQKMMTAVMPSILSDGGIAVVITFHSLEDRIVKTAFKGKQEWQVLTKSPVASTPAEVRLNPRSRSAKLRAARWIAKP